MEKLKFLGFDVGGTKTAWGVFDIEGNLLLENQKPTPQTKDDLIDLIMAVVQKNKVKSIGIGIAGTISADHKDTIICPNIPSLGHAEIVERVKEAGVELVSLENDARAALIGEVWKGAAQDMSSAVLLTLGTGVGGAVMQKGKILPHPLTINQEIGRLIVDSTDVFPNPNGRGTVEAFLGGKNLERRLQISMADIAHGVRAGDKESLEIWEEISYFFEISIKAIHATYYCKNIIIGGRGVNDLEFYMGDKKYPCPILPATLKEKAGLYGAARVAIDLYEADNQTDWD